GLSNQFPSNGFLVLSDSNEFLNCKSHDNGATSTINGLAGYGIYVAGSNNLIERCDFYNNGAWGIHIFNQSGGANNNIVRYSRIFNNSVATSNSDGVILASGTGNSAYGNLIYGSNANGLTVHGSCSSCEVYNNVIYGMSGFGLFIVGSNSVIMNNIIYNNSGGSILNNGRGTVLSNNLTTNPRLVNAATGDFHLQSGSPTIDSGVALTEVTSDIDGTPRPKGNAWDIGAYEYGY